MDFYKKIDELLFMYQHLGVENVSNGAILIGKAPHLAPMAWLNKKFLPLTDEEIISIGNTLKHEIPVDYKLFLTNYSNGLKFGSTTFVLDGLRKNTSRTVEASWQPFSIFTTNMYEKPTDALDSYFFIGGYSWDGSYLYIDTATGKVHYCLANSAKSLKEWNSFKEMLLSELARLISLHDENGVRLIKGGKTTPN